VDDTIEWSEWWLPGKPDRRVKGALTFDPAEGASLTLIEMLPELRGTGFPAEALLGQGFDGTALTLLYPFLAGSFHRSSSTGAWSRSIVVAPTLLRGDHIEDPEALIFKHAIVRFSGLRDACLQEWPSEETGEWVPWVGPGLQARGAKVDGGTLLFRQHEDHTPGKYTRASEIDIEVVISSERALSLSDFDAKWLSPLEALTILVARGPSALQRFTFVMIDANGGETPVEVHTQTPRLAPKPPEEYRPLVRFAALGDNAGAFITRWWRLYRQLGPAAEYLIAALSGEMFLEQKLFAAMSFVESYHRALHNAPVLSKAQHKSNVTSMLAAVEDKAQAARYRAVLQNGLEQSARERVLALIERTHEVLPEVPGLNATLAKELVATRNAIAHLSRSISKALEGVDLLYAVERLRLVIQVNLLVDLGLSRETVGSFVLTSYDRQVPIVDYREEQPRPVRRVPMDTADGS
jgi:ApeA N-terminal domain 1